MNIVSFYAKKKIEDFSVPPCACALRLPSLLVSVFVAPATFFSHTKTTYIFRDDSYSHARIKWYAIHRLKLSLASPIRQK